MRRKWLLRLAVVAGWAVGGVVLWDWVPYREYDTWTRPAGMRIVGNTRDGNEVWIHAGPLPEGWHNPLGIVTFTSHGPIELRDARTGELRQTRLTSDDVFQYVRFVGVANDWLVGRQAVSAAADPDARQLRLLNLTTGTETTVRYTQSRNSSWWEVAENGSAVAVVSAAGGQRQVELFELPSGRPLGTLAGCHEALRFSADGRRFLAYEGRVAGVWEMPAGRRVATLGGDDANRAYFNGPFTPDNELLYDHTGGAWEVATNTLRYQLPEAVRGFSPDGRHALVEAAGSGGTFLHFFDWRTGVEDAGRAVKISDLPLQLYLPNRSADGRYWVTHGSLPSGPGVVSRWLPRFLRPGGPPSSPESLVLTDLDDGRVLARLPVVGGRVVAGRFVVPDGQGRERYYDLPPQRSRPWAAGLLGGWTLVVGGGVAAGRRWVRNRTNPRDPV